MFCKLQTPLENLPFLLYRQLQFQHSRHLPTPPVARRFLLLENTRRLWALRVCTKSLRGSESQLPAGQKSDRTPRAVVQREASCRVETYDSGPYMLSEESVT